MALITVLHNPLDPTTWEEVTVSDVCGFIMARYPAAEGGFPPGSRIYRTTVSEQTDITPTRETAKTAAATLASIGAHERLYVVMWGHHPAVLVAAAIIGAVIVSYALRPSLPSLPEPVASARNSQQASSNNELSERRNKPRVLARIPDIYGRVRSTPDLIAQPYRIFVNNQEIEHAYMCIGRGSYAVEVDEVHDGSTRVANIAGTSVEVYGPGTSPNNGAPELTIGVPIQTAILSAQRSSLVTGQLLRPPGSSTIPAGTPLTFTAPNVVSVGSAIADITALFAAGDVVDIADTVGVPSLAGTYTVLSVGDAELLLDVPANRAAAWNAVAVSGVETSTATIASEVDKWVGPFTLDADDAEGVIANFVAVNGLYKDDGQTQFAADVVVQISVQQLSLQNNPIGAPTVRSVTLNGSSSSREQRAATFEYSLAAPRRYSVRARRITPKDTAFVGNVTDEVKWRDLYATKRVSATDFGNVTTVQSRTYATTGALAVKERKLSMVVTRKLQIVPNGPLVATSKAEDIIRAVALDPYIGGRSELELDTVQITQTMEAIRAHFGYAAVTDFNYTFDNALSFEETVQAVANSAFCTAYRRGNILRVSPELPTLDSKILFNHRNKLPGSETRSVQFGAKDNFDGIAYKYTSPDDDALITRYFPADQSALKYRTVESIGVRNHLQAYFHARRLYQKLLYQNIGVEFTSTQEAAVLLPTNRVLIADNTRGATQDGEVLTQDGLVLALSQPVQGALGATSSLFLQLRDGTVESIPVTAGADPSSVVLAHAPRLPLVLDDDKYARTTYMLTTGQGAASAAFLVTEKDPQPNMTYNVKAKNYDARFYAHDTDYTTGLVDVEGVSTGAGPGGLNRYMVVGTPPHMTGAPGNASYYSGNNGKLSNGQPGAKYG